MQRKVTPSTRNFNSTNADCNSSVEVLLNDPFKPLKELRQNIIALFEKNDRESVAPGCSRIEKLKENVTEYLISCMSETQRT